MQVRLFGELEVVAGGVPVPVRGARQRALLALLALQRGRPVSAGRLIEVLWGDGQAAHPGNALQAQIGQLRRAFGAAAGGGGPGRRRVSGPGRGARAAAGGAAGRVRRRRLR